jgi:RNA polymerase sigma-70 factor (ECF subfamily)
MKTSEERLTASRPEAEATVREIRLRVDELLRDQIHARIRQLVADRDEAEDLTQETLVRVLRGLPQFRGDSSLKTWALRIARNVVIDGRRHAASDPAARAAPPPEGDVDDLEQTRPASPEGELEQTVSADCLRGVLSTLSASYLQVFELHDLAGLANAEIAELLDLPLSTVKIRLHRARRRVQSACAAGCDVFRGCHGEVACSPKDEISR